MSDLTRFSLYPIGRVARGRPHGFEDETFDLGLLPFEIVKDVHIEDVSSLIRKGDFDIHKPGIGEYRIQELERIQYAIIHRYPQHGPDPETGQFLVDADQAERSRRLVRLIAACLRIIRPITTRVQLCEGKVSGNGELYHIAFDEPIPTFSLPTNQRQFSLRNDDAEALRLYGPLFIAAMAGSFWKFRMAVQMYTTGYFQDEDWRIRFFLWTSALEALFTSQNQEHKGGPVAKERIKAHLGASSPIYPRGELVSHVPDPGMTVADIVDEIYCLRNHIAHGDRVPDHYWQATGRADLDGGNLSRTETLIEAISSIVRRSLLRILRDNLLSHFQDDASSEAYFTSLHLTKTDIRRRVRGTSYTCPA
jgi:hypothetical protein